MERKGAVSLWLGKLDSKEELNRLLKIEYDEDGDLIPSKFSTLFKTGRYNDSTREASYEEFPSASLPELLKGFSYDSILIPQFSNCTLDREFTDYNTILLLYDFEYSQELQVFDEDNVYFEFVGVASYA